MAEINELSNPKPVLSCILSACPSGQQLKGEAEGLKSKIASFNPTY